MFIGTTGNCIRLEHVTAPGRAPFSGGGARAYGGAVPGRASVGGDLAAPGSTPVCGGGASPGRTPVVAVGPRPVARRSATTGRECRLAATSPRPAERRLAAMSPRTVALNQVERCVWPYPPL